MLRSAPTRSRMVRGCGLGATPPCCGGTGGGGVPRPPIVYWRGIAAPWCTTVNPFGARTVEFFNWGINERLVELRSYIDRGVPVALGLKGTDGGISHDHQVLAIGYDPGRYQGDLGAYKDELVVFQIQLAKRVDAVPLTRGYIERAEEQLRRRERASPPPLRMTGE